MAIKRNPLRLLEQFEIQYHDSGRDYVTIECPFHADQHDNLQDCHGGIHRENGGFKCFSCGQTSSILNVLAIRMEVPTDAIQAHIDNVAGTEKRGYVDPAVVEAAHTELLTNAEVILKLQNNHGISLDSIKKYKMGWYAPTGRVTLPIYDRDDRLHDMRQYKYGAKLKKMLSVKGCTPVLWPHQTIVESNTLYLTEGEYKCILLRQMGYPAITSTGGAGSFNSDWAYLFKDKIVYIVYDVDASGRKNAMKIGLTLLRLAKAVYNVFLHQVQDIENGDVTDFFVKKLLTKEAFDKTVEATPPFGKPTEQESIILDDRPPITVPLAQASRAEYNGRLIDFTAVVSAKDTAPYIIPRRCTVVCNRDREYCSSCPVTAKTEAYSFEISPNDPIILQLIGTTEKQQNEVLKKVSKVAHQCKFHAMRRDESVNVEEMRLIPQIAIGHTTDEQVTRKGYYVGHGIAANNAYKFDARVASEPGDSHATVLAYRAETTTNDIDSYVDDVDLSVFQPVEWTVEGINAKLEDIYEDFEANVTRIFMRRDMHMFYDLIWHSVLYINFEGRTLKGWGDGLVIGDSGQGKSECSSRLITHYKCGERVDTKRASIAGIVGGLQETGGRWFVTWGTIPLNDRRLVVLEEIKGMGAAELTRLTDMRSSGVAEIIKIERSKTMARTRLVWISNPRSDSKLSSYNYGVDAVKELIGSLEDIRRFDMVIAVASGDVPQEIINRNHSANGIEHKYTSDLCSKLISWVWSRKENDVLLEDDAIDEVLAAATRMGKEYSSACPIVEPSDQRLKILRMATALAARTYSCDESKLKLIVRKAHVQVVEAFMNKLYKSKSLGYHDFSLAQRGEESMADPNAVEEYMKQVPNAPDTIRGMIESELLRVEDIQNFTEWPIDRANDAIGWMIRHNCLRRHRKGGYKKTSAFIEVLKKLDRMDLQSKTFREIAQQGEI